MAISTTIQFIDMMRPNVCFCLGPLSWQNKFCREKNHTHTHTHVSTSKCSHQI